MALFRPVGDTATDGKASQRTIAYTGIVDTSSSINGIIHTVLLVIILRSMRSVETELAILKS